MFCKKPARGQTRTYLYHIIIIVIVIVIVIIIIIIIIIIVNVISCHLIEKYGSDGKAVLF